MIAAWAEPPILDDGAVPLGVAYPRPLSNAALDKVKVTMRKR